MKILRKASLGPNFTGSYKKECKFPKSCHTTIFRQVLGISFFACSKILSKHQFIG